MVWKKKLCNSFLFLTSNHWSKAELCDTIIPSDMLRLENVIGVFKTILDDDSSISLKIACAAVKVYLFFSIENISKIIYYFFHDSVSFHHIFWNPHLFVVCKDIESFGSLLKLRAVPFNPTCKCWRILPPARFQKCIQRASLCLRAYISVKGYLAQSWGVKCREGGSRWTYLEMKVAQTITSRTRCALTLLALLVIFK